MEGVEARMEGADEQRMDSADESLLDEVVRCTVQRPIRYYDRRNRGF
jgi:hypothetical protein